VDLIYKDEAFRIIGACFEVYDEMGAGLLSRSIRSAWSWNWPIAEFHFDHDLRCN
jgi:hypothetical protein